MLSLILLSGFAIQEPEPAFDSQPFVKEAVESETMEQLRKQLASLAEAESYAFRLLTTSERSGGGGRGGQGGQAGQPGRGGQRGADGADGAPGQRGADGQDGADGQRGADAAAPAAPEPQPWEGVYQKGKPVVMKRGELHVARMNDKMAMKSAEGKWEPVAMPSFGGRGQGGARSQGGGQNMDRQRMRDVFAVRSVQLPHDSLESLLGGMDAAQLVREEKLGMVIFHGPLTHEGALAAAMGGNARRMGGFGRGEDDGPQFKAEGKVRFAFGEGGKLLDVRVEASMSGMMREREFAMKNTTEMRVMKIGEAKQEVPQAVMTALATDPNLGEEF